MIKRNLLFFLCCFCGVTGCVQTDLLDNPPKDKAEIFAPGIVSTSDKEHSPLSISPDGKTIYWSFWEMPSTEDNIIRIAYVPVNERIKGSKKLAEFNTESGSFYSCFWGNDKIIFRSKDLLNDFLVVEKYNGRWSDPKPMGFDKYVKETIAPFSVSNKGSICLSGHFSGGAYGTGIYISRYLNNKHTAPELLPDHINTEHLDWTPYFAPDESYLLFASNRPGSYGSTDIYISFKDQDGIWSDPLNMGEKINTELEERFPSVSPDGKIIFFLRDYNRDHQDYYWIEASIIEALKPKGLK